MADKTTGGLKAVEEAAIGSLPGIADLYDDTLLPVEQQGEARHMTGRQWKRYAQEGVTAYVESAKTAAREAAGSAADAAKRAQAAADSARSARQYSGKPPVIKEGRWWTWNAETQRYEDTGQAARGNLMYATFFVEPQTGELYMFTDNEYSGPDFRLVDGSLEVVLNNGN